VPKACCVYHLTTHHSDDLGDYGAMPDGPPCKRGAGGPSSAAWEGRLFGCGSVLNPKDTVSGNSLAFHTRARKV
jgi:hypothetical protein